MAKTRISISLDSDHAERIREHAERAGLDVSAYLVNAATRQMAEAEAAEAQFARIDAVIAAAEAEAAELPPLPDVVDEDLTEQERREVAEAMELIYGADAPAARPGNAA
ncbi:ribbon-helix-helix protein, CopG family [Kitasatospora cineracea]|uniref:Ribbon-helix-helix CopG family protein n=1 Tax=Kitasatospora cineracea TaxID=88074 RepID=A0A3N4RJ34_9ACTN|nr:ribbon-helix-helix protein, CopG family [Kitasatospora cineracea]ROR42897.1 ribbon-helix-helix CopG family protein [Kitasatospora cineracea]RPE33392.1 ribbon-helix-helix CopG family protein [Kitasatospora cineracea]